MDPSMRGRSDSPLAIEVRDVTRRYGDHEALRGVSLEILPGRMFALLGSNGAGKTTLFRIITGLLDPTSGDVSVLGLSRVGDRLEINRRIGVVPDDLALFDRLSIQEHFQMIGSIHRLGRTELERRAGSLLDVLGLSSARGVLAGEASNGMRKKAALGLALLHRPSLLVLDEPFEGIDPVAGLVVRELLKDLAHRGVTVVFTTHILEVVEAMADEVVILDRGLVVHHGLREEWRETGLVEVFRGSVAHDGDRSPDLEWLL